MHKEEGVSSRYLNPSSLERFNLNKGYTLVPAVDPKWRGAEMRLAVILESVDREDLREGTLYLRADSSSPTSISLQNCIRYARLFARKVTGEEYSPAVAVVNWNAAKTYHLDKAGERAMYPSFTRRVNSILKKLDPTHVLVCGDTAAHYFFPDVADLNYKRGWVFDREGVKWSHTLNIEQLVTEHKKDEEDDDYDGVDDAGYSQEPDNGRNADLLYYVSRNVANLLAGRHMFDLSPIVPKPIYVGTVERFDKLMALVKKAQYIALDTETRSLESKANKLHYVQLAFSENKGYVVPIEHPRTPFNEEEIAYIKRKLRALFATRKKENLKTFLTMNGAFDFRVLRAQLNIPFIHHRVYEVTGGEHLIDENLGVFNKVKMRSGKLESRGNLLAIFTSYGNSWYLTAPFGKDDRAHTGMREVDDPDVLDYCSMDVQCLMGIRRRQLEIADSMSVYDYTEGKKRPYRPYFETHLEKQMGAATMAISVLEQNGSHVDFKYMKKLLGNESPLREALAQTMAEFRELAAVREANAAIAKASGSSGSSLFGKAPFVLSLTKPAHKLALFIDTMRLKPLTFTKTGQPQLNKNFIGNYRRQYKEVDLFGEFQDTKKLLGTYVKGWIEKLRAGVDSRKDWRFRAKYAFFFIISGRFISFSPNLQQIPSRGKKAKAIKRMFVAPRGYLQIRADYSAHEVRFWAILSNDGVLAAAFRTAIELKRALVACLPGKKRDKIFEELKTKGDIHIRNVYTFFQMWVTKDHPFRDLIKSTIFGLIYGMAAKSLARDRKNKMTSEARNAVDAAKKGTPEYAKAKKALDELLDKSDAEFLEETEQIVDKVFTLFAQGSQHLERVSAQILRDGWVNAPTGRRRNMFRVFTGKKAYASAAVRGAKNGPIQGISSEFGTRAAYNVLSETDLFLTECGWDTREVFPLYSRTVHDANYFECPYEVVIPFIWIFQYVAMEKTSREYEEDYGFKFPVDPEIEIEISAHEASTYRWDWTLDNLRVAIEKSLDDQVEIGYLDKADRDAALDTILEPARDPKFMALLQERYPLFNVQALSDGVIDLLARPSEAPPKKVAA